MRKSSVVLVFAASTLLLGGCLPTLIAGTAETSTVIAQERTFGRAVDDFTIQADLEGRLISDSLSLFRRVDTEVVEGRVLLTGRVATAEARARAAEIAWSIPRVQRVLNEIEVEPQGRIGTYFNDLRISQQLRGKMATDGKIQFVNYNVETVKGKVILLGVAQNEGELERVTFHARTIPGVTQVVSYVQIKDDPRRLQRL